MRHITLEVEHGRTVGRVIALFDNDTSIIERAPTMPVHWRKDEDNDVCPACGKRALVWLTRQSNHSEHPARCTLQAEPAAAIEVIEEEKKEAA